jgi:serine protease
MSFDVFNRSRLNPLAIATVLVLAGASAPAFAGKANMSGLQSEQSFSRFIVKYRDGSAERKDLNAIGRSLNRAAQSVTVVDPASQKTQGKSTRRAIGLKHLRRMSLGADVVITDRKIDRVDAATLMRQIAADPNVEYVEVDGRKFPTLTPNDPSYSQQWGFTDADAGIRANTAWDVATGAGVIVAVLDTGITSHSDLNANIVAGYDFINDTFVSRDNNGRDSDPADTGDWNPVAGECYTNSPVTNSSWHGTHVAGTVAAVTNNNTGVAGTAFGAKVMPVRVLGRCGGYDSDIADAITWASGGTVSGVPTLAAANVAKVINLSLGGSGACATTSQAAIDGAVSRGTTLVIAAGNDNTNVSNASPANCNNVIAVASVTSSSARSSFSNYGAGIDVSAPGSGIYSTLNSGTTTPGSASYASYSGTSMAAPHVAGTVALVQSRRIALGQPLYTPAQVESLLKSTAYALAGTCTGGCGAGIINAKAAVDAAGGGGGGGTGTVVLNQALPTVATGGVSSNYSVTVPAGTTKLVFDIAGGTGDADMYVRLGSAPTSSAYTCRPYLGGNNETCTINNPAAGSVYFVNVRAYSTFSGVTLKATRTP